MTISVDNVNDQDPIGLAVFHWARNSPMPGSNVFDGDIRKLAVANMIRANTTTVGCSSTSCGQNRAAVACVFSAP
ncbi:hypothetical protein KIN20_035926 [Parelaphostrongylus tenuis]|uniref:SCP domain-containing protein n=1 Tax=Parelaphostrongylus tenuis TaxID=148309 RepID=A0AAD5RCN1_PARTN|nr:hypothetical protein KIN20_035926 [Parelaphostrongylus tenuis]